MYKQLGYGDEARQDQQIERICDHFAASLLMPRMWVKRAYGNRIQDIVALAGLFNVSEEAMHIRLKFLGIIDDEPERVTRTYFRRTGWLREWGPPPAPELDLATLAASSN
jgi:Zn-dependent peptidase ImmA (M78 family)